MFQDVFDLEWDRVSHWLTQPWLISLVLVLVVIVASNWFVHSATNRIREAGRRRGIRLVIRFLTVVVIGVILAMTIGPEWGGFGVFLGVAGAGLAFALQEVISSLAGWLAILGGGFYRTGDRVMLGGIKGDVIEIGMLRTTLMEIGEWVIGDNYSGRIVRVANSFVFKEPVFNYSADFHFLWEELTLPIRFGSNIELAESIVLGAIREELGAVGDASQKEWSRLVRKYRIENARLEPWVSIRLTDNWIELSARFIVNYKLRRSSKDKISRAVLMRIAESDGAVRLGSTTLEILSPSAQG